MPALMAMAALKGNRVNAMGSIMALMTVAHSLGMFSGALMGGLMIDFFQLRSAFPLGGMVMLAGSSLFLLGTNLKKT
jgi:predicted MFS family arabinose efflux permease